MLSLNLKSVATAAVVAAGLVLAAAPAKANSKKAKTPRNWQSIRYTSSYDNTQQQAIIRVSKSKEPRPLLVTLHTWSFGYARTTSYVPWAEPYDFHMIGPDFRGANNKGNKLSMGSDAAVADIVSAVEYMKKHYKVDEKRIYLIGGSGGGHMALLMAGRHPEIWAGVSAWCPISDIVAWFKFHKGRGYGLHISQNLGGNPLKDAAIKAEAMKRSPVAYLHRAKDIPVDIATGIHDGHKGSVPVSHTLNAFNCIVSEKDRFSAEEIAFIDAKEAIPAHLPKPEHDPSYGSRTVLLRRVSGNSRVTIFEGAHHIIGNAGVAWLARQVKGAKADWSVPAAGKESNGSGEVLSK